MNKNGRNTFDTDLERIFIGKHDSDKKRSPSTFVLRHSCPIPQISILRNCSHQKLRILDLPQKSPLWYHEKKSRSSKKIFKIKHKIYFELETF